MIDGRPSIVSILVRQRSARRRQMARGAKRAARSSTPDGTLDNSGRPALEMQTVRSSAEEGPLFSCRRYAFRQWTARSSTAEVRRQTAITLRSRRQGTHLRLPYKDGRQRGHADTQRGHADTQRAYLMN